MQKRYDRELTVAELAAEPEAEIDYSDIPPLDEAFWSRAELVRPKAKRQLTIRLDADVLDWFRTQGSGYQSRINAVLRAYVEARRSGPR